MKNLFGLRGLCCAIMLTSAHAAEPASAPAEPPPVIAGQGALISKLYRRAAGGETVAQFQLGRRYAEGIGMPKETTEAFGWFRKAAMQGHAESQLAAGKALLLGEGVEKNPDEAARWLTFASNAGLGEATRLMGVMRETGNDAAGDLKEAARWYRLAGEQNDAVARFRLAALIGKGKVPELRPGEAESLFTAAANQGLPGARLALAVMLLNRSDPAVRKEGLRWMGLAAEQGVTEAQYRYGLLLAAGDAVGRKRAEDWLDKAALAGDPRAALELGLLLAEHRESGELATRAVALLQNAVITSDARAQYAVGCLTLEGRGTPRDPAAGLALIQKSAVSGYSKAEYRLACIYETGEAGIPADSRKFSHWLGKASAQDYKPAKNHRAARALMAMESAALRGEPAAQFALAVRYDAGDELVRADPAESTRLYLAAAEQGHRNAQFIAAQRLRNGVGTRKDIPGAIRLFTLAGRQGDADAWYALAAIYNTAGPLQNTEESSACLFNAAKLNHASAQSEYGVRMWNGKGVTTDKVAAYAWVLLSFEQKRTDDGEPELSMRMLLDPASRANAAERREELRAAIRRRLALVTAN